MSIGQKLKDARKNAGLSQEQLAEKLCVSRQAITKWESDKGIPDVENLQNISKLFDVSIDSLLDDSEAFPSGIIKESINLEDYPKEGKFKSKYDAVVKAKYPDAHSIMPLVRKKKLSTVEKALDFLIQPGVYHVADSINDMSAYYLVEKGSKQYLVNVTKDFIESRELARHFTGRGQTIGNNYFTKALYADLVEKK